MWLTNIQLTACSTSNSCIPLWILRESSEAEDLTLQHPSEADSAELDCIRLILTVWIRELRRFGRYIVRLGPDGRASISNGSKRSVLHTVQTEALGSTHPSVQSVPGLCPRGQSIRDKKLTTYIHLTKVDRQRSGLDSLRYQIFWEVVGLERGPFSLMGTIEELLERRSSGSGLENRDTAVGDSPRWLPDTPLSTKVGTKFAACRRT
jgi:hypothetical protein